MSTNSVISYTIARTAHESGHLKEGRRILKALDPDFARCATWACLNFVIVWSCARVIVTSGMKPKFTVLKGGTPSYRFHLKFDCKPL